VTTALRWGSATDTGLVRRNNQDHLLVDGTLFAVADGMGGHAGGEVASQVAIEALRTAFTSSGEAPDAESLVGAVREANAAVLETAEGDPALRGMGTTLTAAAVVTEEGEERIAIANVGDSRAYVFAHGDLTQLTEDHSVAEELARAGEIGPDEVDSHPQRHILTRALGIFPEVAVDLWEVLPYPGDRVLLCSDGLVREVNDDQIAAVLRRLADPGQAVEELVARARAAGGSDNITVVLIDVVEGQVAVPGSVGAAEAAPAVPEAMPVTATAPRARGSRSHRQGSRRPTSDAPVRLRPPRPRRATLRVAVFVVVLLALVAAAVFAIAAYARNSYFVTLGAPGTAPASPLTTASSRPLVIEKGRPGGLLWFRPTLAARTTVLSDEVLPSRLPQLRGGQSEPSLAAARTFIENLVKEAARAAPSPTAP
jgi:protein phosphatase